MLNARDAELTRSLVIHLNCEDRAEGAVYITSPDLPLLHLVVERSEAEDLVTEVIKGYFRLRHQATVEVRLADDLAGFLREPMHAPCIPPYVIAQIAA